MDDLTTLTDADLDALRVDVANETERRARLAAAPDQARDLARRYREDGGQVATLVDAITGDDAGRE